MRGVSRFPEVSRDRENPISRPVAPGAKRVAIESKKRHGDLRRRPIRSRCRPAPRPDDRPQECLSKLFGLPRHAGAEGPAASVWRRPRSAMSLNHNAEWRCRRSGRAVDSVGPRRAWARGRLAAQGPDSEFPLTLSVTSAQLFAVPSPCYAAQGASRSRFVAHKYIYTSTTLTFRIKTLRWAPFAVPRWASNWDMNL